MRKRKEIPAVKARWKLAWRAARDPSLDYLFDEAILGYPFALVRGMALGLRERPGDSLQEKWERIRYERFARKGEPRVPRGVPSGARRNLRPFLWLKRSLLLLIRGYPS